MATSTIKIMPNKMEIVPYEEQTLTSGYCAISYPSGYSSSDEVVIQPTYTGNSQLGWTATLQKRTSDVILYIRQGIVQPADNTKVSFTAIFIKAS